MAISSNGFAAQFARGPGSSRFYLQHRPEAHGMFGDGEWIWTQNYQEFPRWVTEMVHDAGDESLPGRSGRRLAKARLDRLFASVPAAAAFAGLADLMAGIK